MTASLPSGLEPLAKMLQAGRHKLLVFVGTGVSVGAARVKQVSWPGLLQHGVQHLVDIGDFTPLYGEKLAAAIGDAFEPFDLNRALNCAELVQRALRTPDDAAFGRWLEAAFCGLKGESKTLDAIRDLQQAGALLATTNYDSLLSDATGLSPVTWLDRGEFHRVMTERSTGILHIHGHWKRPESVVLGEKSYHLISADKDFQTFLKSLWLHHPWLYVGCGNGLDDPNIGTLLTWGKDWEESSFPQRFLARADKVQAINLRPGKPKNLIPCGYADHEDDLPRALRSIMPKPRLFAKVDAESRLFRSPESSVRDVPVPSFQEYADGDVPAFKIDGEVRRRIHEHGWASAIGPPAVGKTTLALRIATSEERRNRPAYYLNLGNVDEETDPVAFADLYRLSRTNALLILDNVHRRPTLARQLYDSWQVNRDEESQLLLLSTDTLSGHLGPDTEALRSFTHHVTNPAVEFTTTAEDIRSIMEYLYLHAGGTRSALPTPPSPALLHWHRTYGCLLNAFCLAILGWLDELRCGNWDLPSQAAVKWVRERWLDKCGLENRENLLCLAAFGAQELELRVTEEGLPHPGRTEQLGQLGLIARADLGPSGQYHQFALREPGWGEFIVAAQSPSIDEEKVLFAAAARHPMMACFLDSRLRRQGRREKLLRMWAFIGSNADASVQAAQSLPLSYFPSLVQAAKMGLQPVLTDLLWRAIESDPRRLAEHAWETPLHFLAAFFGTAKRHGRPAESIDRLWMAIESDPRRLAERAWETPLGDVAALLNAAKRHGRPAESIDRLWTAIESDPLRLAERAWEPPLHFTAAFLDAAKRHGRPAESIDRLWTAVESDHHRLAECALETPLEHLAHFVDVLDQHGRNGEWLWESIEEHPEKLIARAWETPLEHLACFFQTASAHGRKLDALVTAFKDDARRLSAIAKRTSVTSLAAFCHQVPEILAEAAMSDFQATYWDGIPAKECFQSGTGLAETCCKIGREDLALPLRTLILRRANPRDFPSQGSGFANVAALLQNCPPASSALVPVFLNTVCTPTWLDSQYKWASCGSLAGGLRRLALYQPSDVRRRFVRSRLADRLHVELNRFDVDATTQSLIIQFVGAAMLFGLRVNPQWFNKLSLDRVAALPVSVLVHDPEDVKVQDWQLQLWLGLRETALATRTPIPVPSPIIAQTLSLWRENLLQSSAASESKEHRMNLRMVTWLERCLQDGRGFLLPDS